jgi:putative hydrolase of the HAD superfamily
MHIDTVFFDWGGVIADDPGEDFLTRVLLDAGASNEQAQAIYVTYMRDFISGKISEAAFWQALRDHYGLTIHPSISDTFLEWRGLIANKQVLALADKAKTLGLKTALLSNMIEPTYNALLKTDHFGRFDATIISWQVGCAKPDEAIYHLALEHMHTAAERSLFIDDKQKNLDPAAKLGFTTILAYNPEQIVRDVSAALQIQP